MDSFELNKIAGAVLATGLLVMALSIMSEIIYQPADLRENGYVIVVPDEGEGGNAEAMAAISEIPPIAARLQTAEVSAGESAARKCQACHTFDQGGPPKVGPNLYGIVGAPFGHLEGFRYSATMTEGRDAGDTWTYERLDDFLANPKADMPGTLMAFAGIRKPEERADIIAYLRTLSDSPVPLPEPPAPEENAAALEEMSEEQEAGAAAAETGTGDTSTADPSPGEVETPESDTTASESDTAGETEPAETPGTDDAASGSDASSPMTPEVATPPETNEAEASESTPAAPAPEASGTDTMESALPESMPSESAPMPEAGETDASNATPMTPADGPATGDAMPDGAASDATPATNDSAPAMPNPDSNAATPPAAPSEPATGETAQ